MTFFFLLKWLFLVIICLGVGANEWFGYEKIKYR